MDTATIAGTTYQLSALTLGDLRQFRIFVQYLPYLRFMELRESLPDDVFKEEAAKIRNDCAGRHLVEGDEVVADMMDTAEGTAQLVYLSMKKKHPNLTYAEVYNMMRDPGAFQLVQSVLILSGLVSAVDVAPEKKSDGASVTASTSPSLPATV